MNVVIDGDGMLYRSGFAAEKRQYLIRGNAFPTKAQALEYARGIEADPDELQTLVEVEPAANVLHTLKLQIHKIMGAVEQEYGKLGQVMIVLSGPENYRFDVATIRPYKGNRDPDHKPVHMHVMREYLKSRFGAVVSKGVEADDVVAQIGTSNRGRIVMAGMDKDLWQVPGLHYDFHRGQHFEISDEQGLCNLYQQIMQGDSTDNIVGCYRMGETKAIALVEAVRESAHTRAVLEERLYRAALDCYEQSLEKFGDRCPYAHMAPEDALAETAHLVYLRRSRSDQWTPPLLD